MDKTELKTMKISKMVAMMCAIVIALSSCRGTEEDWSGGDGSGFKVTASAGVIYGDGEDEVVFTPTFNGRPIEASKVKVYDGLSDMELFLDNLTFSVDATGTFYFYFKVEINGEIYESEKLMVIVIARQVLDFSDIEQEGLTITPVTTLFQIGIEDAVIIVRRDGKVLDAIYDDVVTFYDYETNEEIEMTTKKLVDDNGKEMLMYCYAPKEACIRTIWASYKTLNTKNKPIKITAVEDPVPAAAIDTDPENTSFERRSLLLQITGTGCPNCPVLMDVIGALRADEEYADTFVHVGVHTYNANDPMYYKEPGFEPAINFLAGEYPGYVLDLKYSGPYNGGNFKTELGAAQEEGAKAGISARIQSNGPVVNARVSVKAAVEGEYYVAAMLVESGIVAVQQGDQTGKYKVHENALRLADGKTFGKYIGYPLGLIGAGESVDYLFNLPLENNWVQGNCHVVFYVTSPDENDKKIVVNAVASDSLNGTIEYDYK